MTQQFPPLREVFINSNKGFEQFLITVTETIQNQIQYVDDSVTKKQWSDLVYNGITTTKPMTPGVLANILEVTDKKKTG